MAHATNDIQAVEMTAGEGVLTLVDSIMVGVLVLSIMCSQYSWQLTLVSLLPEWQQPRVPIYLLFPERRLMPRKLRAFIDFLVANGPAYGIDKLL